MNAIKFSPLLASNADISLLHFPLYGSPKIDGIRAVIRDGVVYARSGKPLPNAYVQKTFGHLHGYDGELVVGSAVAPDCFCQSQSGIMSKKGEPNCTFFVFDWWTLAKFPYSIRFSMQVNVNLPKNVHILEQTYLHNLAELDAFEASCLEQGFEGVMLRKPSACYKFGRSTVKEGILLKVKRFSDGEGEILGLEEQHNKQGQTNNTLGALRVRCLESGEIFYLGTGFSSEERQDLWQQGQALNGRYVRFKHFFVGAKEKPRFPVFAGLRHECDMSLKNQGSK